MTATNPPKRKADRREASIRATLGGAIGLRASVTLVDFSRSGCRVRTATRHRRGTALTLRIGVMAPMSVSVAWSDGTHCGLSFVRPLDESLFRSMTAAAEAQIAARTAAGVEADVMDSSGMGAG